MAARCSEQGTSVQTHLPRCAASVAGASSAHAAPAMGLLRYMRAGLLPHALKSEGSSGAPLAQPHSPPPTRPAVCSGEAAWRVVRLAIKRQLPVLDRSKKLQAGSAWQCSQQLCSVAPLSTPPCSHSPSYERLPCSHSPSYHAPPSEAQVRSEAPIQQPKAAVPAGPLLQRSAASCCEGRLSMRASVAPGAVLAQPLSAAAAVPVRVSSAMQSDPTARQCLRGEGRGAG